MISSGPDHTDSSGSGGFSNAFLEALDRMQNRETVRPEQLADRACALLKERCGPEGGSPVTAFSRGAAGLMGQHTHYFDGFAFLLMLPQGTAVAARRSIGPCSTLVFEGEGRPWVFEDTATKTQASHPPASAELHAGLVRALVGRLVPHGHPVDIAVVSTVWPSCVEAYLAALVMATGRALQRLFTPAGSEAPEPGSRALLDTASDVVTRCLRAPFSTAYLLAADSGPPDTFMLIDTANGEQIALEAPRTRVLSWGLIDVKTEPKGDAALYRKYRTRAQEALVLLQQRGFSISSWRDLEHQDLQRAQQVLPRRYRPVARFLVSENRRVQNLVSAVRRKDWQMVGGVLFISHASVRNDWSGTSPEVDFVVSEVEGMSLDGMYGACVTGRSSCVLIVGQPFVVPRCLDRIKESFEARFGSVPEAILL